MVLVTGFISKNIPTFPLKNGTPAVPDPIQNKPHSLPPGISFTVDANNYKPNKNDIYVLSTPGIGYQSFTNTTALMMTVHGRELEFCIDTGSSLSLIADSALREFFSDIKVLTMTKG